MTDAGEQLTGDAVAFVGSIEGTRGVLRVDGELDAAATSELQAQCAALRRQGARDLVLELDATTFIDSSGLGALLSIERDVRDTGGEVRLRAPHQAVLRLLEITGLSDHFPIDF